MQLLCAFAIFLLTSVGSAAELAPGIRPPGKLSRPLEMRKGSRAHAAKRTATSCETYLEALKEGYLAGSSTAERADESLYKQACQVVELEPLLKPSKETHVGDYTFSERSLGELPPCIAAPLAEDNGSMDATKSGVGLREFSPETQLIAASKDSIRFKTDSTEYLIELLGHGDVDDDGVEDLVLLVSGHVIGGTLGLQPEVLVVTKKAGDKVFRVISSDEAKALEHVDLLSCPGTLGASFPSCGRPELDAAKAAFKSSYDKGSYAEAFAQLQRFLHECQFHYPLSTQAWLVSDAMLSAYKAKDYKACKRIPPILDRLENTTSPNELKAKAAIEHNRMLCKDAARTAPK